MTDEVWAEGEPEERKRERGMHVRKNDQERGHMWELKNNIWF